MLDLFYIPSNTENTKIFYANGSTAWQTWNKPRNAKFIQIFCLGSGGGGGGGGLNVAGTAINAGGGGACAGYSRCIYPAAFLPDNLYVQVAVGGSGGAGSNTSNSNGSSGTAGAISYVAIQPANTAIGVIAQSTNTIAGGGNGNGNVTGAVAAWTTATNPFTILGLILATAGIAGLAQNTAGTTAITSSIVTQGAGGGSKPANNQNAGGSIFSASVVLTTQLNGGVAGGSPGKDGYGSLIPFCGTGGSGGGGNLTGNGGRGGDGWYGCGGGGAGSGLSTGGFRGGNGGRGGNGIVIITTIF
jgi:hypothetical protein